MQLSFLGGASAIGASCLALELAGRHVLIDAGVRMDPNADRLPDLAALDGRDLAAIFVTHAHADHIGALPLVHQHFANLPIYASLATIRLMEVMLADALRVMERRAVEELEIPLYDASLVESMLRMLRPLPLGQQSIPGLPGVTLHVTRAGHVAGAVGFGFEAPDGRVVISGDVSMTPQRTILGAATPAPLRPDLLVLESTYGTRMHPNRQAEEQRLAQAVAEGVSRGHVLVPAFALGRAQEVLLILRAAQRDGLIPEFPIYVDGLVRTVCAAYTSFPEALSPTLRKHILRGGKPFFSGTTQAIESPAQRERILMGPPCCIVASSGMLTGGPSAFYAARLIERPEASILITGYQDEESPGRKLLHAVGAGTITLDGRSQALRCRVEKYALSAHADGTELAALVSALSPRALALVHGDPEARTALAARLQGQTEVILPRDGESLMFGQGSKKFIVPPQNPVTPTQRLASQTAPASAADLERLWRAISDGTGLQSFSLRELARFWYADAVEADIGVIQQALETKQPFFAPIPGIAGLWRVLEAVEVRRAQAAGIQRGSGQRPNQAYIQDSIDRHLSHATDLYRRSIDAESGAITLGFYFPDVAKQRYAEQLEAIRSETQLELEISPQPHQGMLAEAALAVLPSSLTSLRTPSILFELRIVRLHCEGQADQESVHDAQEQFQLQTGWKLDLGNAARAESGPGLFLPATRFEPLDFQQAIWSAEEMFSAETGCYKIGADQQAMLLILRFDFPDAARLQYADWLQKLADSTGWRVQLHPHPNQSALIEAARDYLPQTLIITGTPSIMPTARELALRYIGTASPQELEDAQDAFRERTAWKLRLRMRDEG